MQMSLNLPCFFSFYEQWRIQQFLQISQKFVLQVLKFARVMHPAMPEDFWHPVSEFCFPLLDKQLQLQFQIGLRTFRIGIFWSVRLLNQLSFIYQPLVVWGVDIEFWSKGIHLWSVLLPGEFLTGNSVLRLVRFFNNRTPSCFPVLVRPARTLNTMGVATSTLNSLVVAGNALPSGGGILPTKLIGAVCTVFSHESNKITGL